MAHLESFRTNTVDTRAAYVAVSRAKTFAAIYTDDRHPRTSQGRGDRDRVAESSHPSTLLYQAALYLSQLS